MNVGFVGVGRMGAAMAGHVAEAGFDVICYDTDSATLAEAAIGKVRAADDLGEIARTSDVVIVVVNTDAQSRAVVKSILEGDPKAEQVLVIAATNHPGTMIGLAKLAGDKGLGFVDAPVCYGLQGAIKGDLISLCGGSEADVKKVYPVLMAYSRSVEHLGATGTGQLGKACNNMMHWAACVASYETLALAKACGIDAQAMRETLLKCPAYNRTLDRWDNSKFTWHEKDMDVVLDLSQQAGLALPLFGTIDQLVKRLGPDGVKALLYGEEAEYIGQKVRPKSLAEVASPT